MCSCDLCRAREIGCHSLELFFGADSVESDLVRADNGSRKVQEYEKEANFIRHGSILPKHMVRT